MSAIVDFHTHILPSMDDGSRNVKESLSMLREEARQGVTAVVLTPHFYAFENSPDRFLERRCRAWEALSPHLERVPSLLLGAEVHYFEGICATKGLERLCIEGTDLLLLEMPMSRWTSRMVDDVIELNNRRQLQIVLVHIERYLSMQASQIIEKLLSYGVLFQANVTFFSDWRTRYKALSMMKKGQLHLLGSDCHSMRTRRPNWEKLPEGAARLHRQGYQILLRHRLERE